MNIVIDKAIVDDFVATLAAYKEALVEVKSQLQAAQVQIELDTLFTIQQARHYLGDISEDKLLGFRKRGLDYYKKGKDGVWYRKSDIDTWLSAGKVNRRGLMMGNPK